MSDDPTGLGPDDAPPGHDTALDTVMAQWVATTPDVIDVDGALARVNARRRSGAIAGAAADDLAARRASNVESSRAVPLWQRTTFRTAAALVLVAGAAAVWRSATAGSGAASYVTTTGTTQQIRLADGSDVRLGPASSLQLAPGFGRTHRRLTLHGEAWFRVTHNEAMPFAIKVGAATVEDVGTSFLVRESPSREVSVRVTEGAVTLTSPAAQHDSTVMLRAGDGAVATIDGITVAPGAVTVTEGVSLAAGHLTFADASLAEVGDALRRWYGVSLIIGDSALATRRLTADFTSEPVSRVAAVLGLTLGVTAEARGDTIELHSATGMPSRP